MIVELDSDMRQALEDFIAERDEPPGGRMSASQAVNVIMRDWLTGQGYLALPGDDEEIVHALDAAEVPKK